MVRTDLVKEGAADLSDKERMAAFRDIVWIWDVGERKLVEEILNTVREQLDSVENFAQYVARRLQNYGLVVAMESSITPVNDGYTLVVSFRLRGIRKDVVDKARRLLWRHSKGWTTAGIKYKRAEEEMSEGVGSEREAGDSTARADSEEVEEEG